MSRQDPEQAHFHRGERGRLPSEGRFEASEVDDQIPRLKDVASDEGRRCAAENPPKSSQELTQLDRSRKAVVRACLEPLEAPFFACRQYQDG